MKNFDSRTYSISDFLEWYSNGQLELNPKFQRRSVWDDNARSYLMDTIIRGFPIPKVFIRQKLNVTTRNNIREVVDGQQRLRTILSFLQDGFVLSPKHNSKYGGLYFSQLDQIDDEVQSNILSYEISVDLLVNMPDPKVLDIFSRLNSYSVVLNDQEKINANHFGPFKLLADQISKEFFSFWIENKILTEKKILRMEDVSLTADLLIAMCVGIKEKKKIKYYYDLFERNFDYDVVILGDRFKFIIDTINQIYKEGLISTEFKRVPLFYTLFTSIYHLYFGLEGLDLEVPNILENERNFPLVCQRLERVNYLYEMATSENVIGMTNEERLFIDNCRRATTDASKREARTRFIINLMVNGNQ